MPSYTILIKLQWFYGTISWWMNVLSLKEIFIINSQWKKTTYEYSSIFGFSPTHSLTLAKMELEL